ncbi:unnamed protein product, partial [Pocillopora meandrina]
AGIVQYFFKHSLTIRSPTGKNVNLLYTLACVHWYKVHPHARFYSGLLIQACLPSFEVESMAAFIPVMRIDSVCGIAELSYNLGTANGKEKIVVAVPLDLKLHWVAAGFCLRHCNKSLLLYGLIGLFQMMTQYNHYSTASNNHNVSNDQRGSLVLTLSNDQTASNGPNG